VIGVLSYYWCGSWWLFSPLLLLHRGSRKHNEDRVYTVHSTQEDRIPRYTRRRYEDEKLLDLAAWGAEVRKEHVRRRMRRAHQSYATRRTLSQTHPIGAYLHRPRPRPGRNRRLWCSRCLPPTHRNHRPQAIERQSGTRQRRVPQCVSEYDQ
jgi:hypothetical protein